VRGLGILRAFAPHNAWLGNHELAERVGLPRPTVSRLTAKLTEMNYLEYSERLAQYRLGTSVLALGYLAASNLNIRVLVRERLQALADREQAIVVLGSKDGLWMHCDEVCHSNSSIVTLRVNVGSRLSFARSVMGLALAGAMPDAERTEILEQVRREHRKSWRKLELRFSNAREQIRKSGFCVALETLEKSVNGVGVAVEVPGQPLRFAIGCAGPSFLFPQKRLEQEIGPKLVAIKNALQRELQARGKSLT
jgi:DNA-binding IclR family transcriptional regulator